MPGKSEKKLSRFPTRRSTSSWSYAWPGNVRELENCIERAILLSTDGVIQNYHLSPRLQWEEISQSTKCRGAFEAMIAAYEQEILLEKLKRCCGNIRPNKTFLSLKHKYSDYSLWIYSFPSAMMHQCKQLKDQQLQRKSL